MQHETTARATLAEALRRLRMELPGLPDAALRPLVERELQTLTQLAEDEVRALRASEKRFRDLFENSPDPSWLIENGRFTDCNHAAMEALGYARKEDMLRHPANISPEFQPDGRSSFEKAEEMIQRALDAGVHRFEWEHRRVDGSCFPAEVTLAKIDMQAHVALYCVWRDITMRKQAEQQAYDLAFFDPLTHLPNRRLLHDRLDGAMQASSHSGLHGALLYLDLDHFKVINDTQGHAMGDRMLAEVAGRLTGAVRDRDTVARMGGDEFVLLIQHLSEDAGMAVNQARRVGEKLQQQLARPCVLDGVPYQSSASIGITMFSGQGTDAGELLKRADLAMYQAKGAGRAGICFFDPAIQAGISARAQLESDLRLALARNELQLYFQPQVDASGRCIGVEALLRWTYPQRGLVLPGEFIPVAEDSGLIVPIGEWVLAQACRILEDWQAQPLTATLHMAVNVSARQLQQPEFVQIVRALLGSSRAEPARLRLEITESMLLQNIEQTIIIMQELRGLGVGFSLDDFGTGYSSLNYLKRLPLDLLKIDKSFVHDIHTDPNDAAICRAVIAMGRSLGLTTMAEGVETQAQWDYLAQEGCDAAQGFLYAKPMPQAAFEAWLAQRD